jgi:hypothetical protein
MSRQGRILAGQVVLSALILIVVYVTLLRPEGGGSLSAVEAPNGASPTTGQTPGPQQANRDAAAGADRRNRPGRTTTGTLPTPLVPPATPSISIEQPTGDQYSDSLEQLRARLAAG